MVVQIVLLKLTFSFAFLLSRSFQ